MKTKRFFALALTVIMMFSLLPHAFAAEDITAMLAEYQKQAQAMQQEVIAQQEAARQDLALAQQQATQQVQQAQADMQKAYKQATCKHEWKRTYTEDKDETDGVHDEVTVCIDCEKELERVTVEDEKEQTATLRTALKAAPEDNVEYPLWVGAVKVNSANRGNILGDGTASFDPDSKTLRLNNANIRNAHNYYNIHTENMDLNVELSGSSSLSNYATAIYVQGNLNITGGSLTATCSNQSIYANNITIRGSVINAIATSNYAINCSGNLTITNSSVTATSDESNAISTGTLTINGESRLYARSATSAVIMNGITIGEGLAITTPEAGYFSGGYICDSTGNNAGSVVIEQVSKYAITCPADPGAGGTVSADITSAAVGTKVTLTVTPTSGYMLESLTVKNGEADVATKKVNDTTYTFMMPAAPVTVSAVFDPVYTVTCTAVPEAGGRVTADKTSATDGTEVTLTVKPAVGYMFKTIRVMNEETEVTTKQDTTDNRKYTFTMPAANVTVVCTFAIARQCGDNLNYELDVSGNLVIAGTGDMWDSVFTQNTDIISVTISNGVTSIGKEEFHSCTSLKNITIPDSVTSIGGSAFQSCTSLENVAIPRITKIEDYTFSSCRSLKSVTIPDSVKSIGDGAFSGCTNLESVIIPSSVTSIGAFVFDWCESRTHIYVDNLENVVSAGNYWNGEATVHWKHNVTINNPTEGGMVTGGGIYWGKSPDTGNPDTVALTISPAAGYELDTLSVTDVNNNPIALNNNSFSMPEADVTVTATFKQAAVTTYTVGCEAEPKAGGTLLTDLTSAAAGTEVTLTATPAEGYELDSLTVKDASGNPVSVTNNEFTMPAANVTVTATFKLKTFTIKFVNDDGTELQSVTVAYGEMPAYTGKTPVKPADTDYTYKFRGWEPAIASVTGEATYKATYTATENKYTFTYTWSEDNSTVTAMRTCTNNPDLSVTEVVKTTSEGTAATCEAAGKVTYTAVFKNTAFEKQTKTVETPALGHEWMVREELWAGDYSSVTVTFVCENDPTHTKKETAAASESISGSVVTYTAAITLDGKQFPFSKSVDIAGQGYVFTHTTQVWVKGSTEGATFRVTRLGDDRWTYRLFTGIRVDGAPVSAYSKAPGSIILTLHPAYLDSLSVGYHTLAVYFTDGEATADFLILPAGGSYYNNSTSERYTYVPPSNVPRTGDESNLALWGALAIVSAAGIALLIVRKRKKT